MTLVIEGSGPPRDNGGMPETSWTELLMTDHETTERVFDAFDRALAGPSAPSTAIVTDALEYFTGYVERCHNHKEEDHLFPLLEASGMPRDGGPLGIMIADHRKSEEALAALRSAAAAYTAGSQDALASLRTAFSEYSGVLKEHFWKENDILFPMGRRILDDADDARVIKGIEAVEAGIGTDTRQRYYALARRIVDASEIQDLSAGLDADVLAAMLNTLPVEISFVDADDRVRYFSHENAAKIFPRTRGAIGRAVQQCHPPKSVHKVNAILESFKSGKRNVAEFWLDLGGRKVHVRYFAVRSAENRYMGTVETVQDITDIQQIRGERRLVDEALAV
jgi:PAS domain S-box-containing protein